MVRRDVLNVQRTNFKEPLVQVSGTACEDHELKGARGR
jgi:hypothetical protein